MPLRDISRTKDAALDLTQGNVAAFESLLALLRRGANPALLILEDIHWADVATLDMIRFLGRRIAGARALVLATYRDEEVGVRSPLRDVLGEAPAGSVQRMTVEPLSLPAVNTLAASTGRSGEDVYRLTGGNPFLVTEALAVEGDTTPETVRDATLSRAARLPPAARTLLHAVSIFPRRAELEIVKSLVGDDIDEALDACVERGMLRIDGDALKFRHELARRAIEASLPPSAVRGLHQKVVDILQAAPDARASEISHHAELAGNTAALVKHARLAGDEAARAGAAREAAAHYGAMLKHRDLLGPALTVETLEKHAEQSYLMGSPAIAVESMTEAAEMRRASGDLVALGRDLTRLTRYCWICGKRSDAERCVAEAIAVLEEHGETPELAWAYSHKSQLDMLAADEPGAIRWGQRALQLAENLQSKEIIVHALGNIGAARMQDDESAVTELEKSFQLARAAGLHDHVERASCNLTCTAYWRRDHQRASEYIERGVAYAAERDLVHWEAYLLGWRALSLLDQGEYGQAEAEAQSVSGWRGVPDLYRTPALFALSRLRVRRGDPDAETPLEEARRLTEQLRELQRDTYTVTIEAERLWLARSASEEAADRKPRATGQREADVLCSLREVHARALERNLHWAIDDTALWLHLLGESVDAEALSRPICHHVTGEWAKAAEEWRELGYPYEQALALSDGDESAQREALSILDRLGATPAAARLRRLMRAAGVRAIPRGPTSSTRANPIGLTQRQVQVLELVSEGLSNPEIADRLCISAKTAEHHVSALMTRLEATTRREAAANARRLGLLGAARP